MRIANTLDASFATYNPCLLIVRDKGFEVRIKSYRSETKPVTCLYFAINNEIQLVASSAPELLGLVVLWETYGSNWNQQEPNIMDEALSVELIDSEIAPPTA